MQGRRCEPGFRIRALRIRRVRTLKFVLNPMGGVRDPRVFLPDTSGDLAKSWAMLESTHFGDSKMALFAGEPSGLVLAGG